MLAHFRLGDIDMHAAGAVNLKPDRWGKSIAGAGRGEIVSRILAAATRQHAANAHNKSCADGARQE